MQVSLLLWDLLRLCPVREDMTRLASRSHMARSTRVLLRLSLTRPTEPFLQWVGCWFRSLVLSPRSFLFRVSTVMGMPARLLLSPVVATADLRSISRLRPSAFSFLVCGILVLVESGPPTRVPWFYSPGLRNEEIPVPRARRNA